MPVSVVLGIIGSKPVLPTERSVPGKFEIKRGSNFPSPSAKEAVVQTEI